MSEAPATSAAPAPRAQLIHIEVDRRLGHEWDEWDGKPLPGEGNYDSAPKLFFAWSAASIAIVGLLVALFLYLLGPRLASIHPEAPRMLWLIWGLGLGVVIVWWVLLAVSYQTRTGILPERLAERGPLLRLM